MTWPVLRGQVVRVDLGLDEPKMVVVVSNNRRNRALPQVLAARLTTSPKPAIPSIVELDHPEIFVGRVSCDDIVEVYEDEVVGVLGALSSQAMSSINKALMSALGLNGPR